MASLCRHFEGTCRRIPMITELQMQTSSSSVSQAFLYSLEPGLSELVSEKCCGDEWAGNPEKKEIVTKVSQSFWNFRPFWCVGPLDSIFLVLLYCFIRAIVCVCVTAAAFMALRFCCSLLCYCGFLKPLWPWSHLKLLFVLEKIDTMMEGWKGDIASWLTAPLVYYWLWPWYCHECRTPLDKGAKDNAFLISGKILDGKWLVYWGRSWSWFDLWWVLEVD